MSIKVMSRVWETSKLKKATARLLLLAIADHAADDGYCWPSTDTLAHKIGMDVRSVYRLTKEIEAAGELLTIRTNRNNRYIVTLGMTQEEIDATLKSRGIDRAAIGDSLSRNKEADEPPIGDNLSPSSDTCVTSQVTELCHSNHHEPSVNRQESGVFSDVGEGVEETFPTESMLPPRKNGKSKVATFHTTGDPVADRAIGAALRQERKIPDWAIPGPEGPDPFFPVAKVFCELTGQSLDGTKAKTGKTWLKHFAKLAQDNSITPEQMIEAHRVLPGKEWGSWYLQQHKWADPFEESYVKMMTYAARQIRNGTLETTNGWSKAL